VAPPKKKGGRVTPKGGVADSKKVPTAGPPVVSRSSSGGSSGGRPARGDGAVTSSSRYTPPVPMKIKGPSPLWIPVLLFGLLIVGSLIIILNYMTLLPNSPQNYYLIAGLVAILGGIMVATQFR
jgi:hypothetical protein